MLVQYAGLINMHIIFVIIIGIGNSCLSLALILHTLSPRQVLFNNTERSARKLMVIFVQTACSWCSLTRILNVLMPVTRAVPSTRVALLELNKARAFFIMSSSVRKKLQTPNSEKNWQTSCQTFVTQLCDKFCLAWDDVNQFKDCDTHGA